MLSRPSLVTLVSNPSPTTSTFEWIPTNVKSMNRTNKLSSIPFYAPNDESKKYQFRLVLLRGVVKGATEDEDPLALYLEYLPPATGASSNNAEHAAAPGNCKIAIWCVNRFLAETEEAAARKAHAEAHASASGSTSDAPPLVFSLSRTPHGGAGSAPNDAHRYEETHFSFTANERMTGFKEFVSAADMENEAFVDPNAFNAMTIRIELTTGVESVVDVVAKTTDRWASSLWGSATSVFAAVSTGLDALKAQVLNTIEERHESAAAGGATDDAAGAEAHRTLPWEELPAPWKKAGSTLDDWRSLITGTIIEDEGTFLFGADRGLHPDEQVLMTQLGLNHKAIMNASTLFDFDRDVHEGLLSVPSIRKQRYQLVPKLISDKKFWGNYMWKVAALSTAPKSDQIHLLLSIVNAPPRVTKKANAEGSSVRQRAGGSPVGGPDSSSAAATGSAAAASSTSLSDSPAAILHRFEREVADLAKEALEAAELLQELLDDEAEEVLVATAVQSCEECGGRIGDILGRMAAAAASSPADVAEGVAPLTEAMLATRKQIESVLARSKSDPDGGDSTPVTTTKTTAADAAAAVATSVHEADAHTANTSLEVPSATTPAEVVAAVEEEVPSATGVEEVPAEVVGPISTAPENATADVEISAAPETETVNVNGVDEEQANTDQEQANAHADEGAKTSGSTAASSFEMVASPKPKEPEVATTTNVIAPKKPSTSAGLDFLDDDFPELSSSPTGKASAASVGHTAPAKEASVTSTTKKIEFEPMPWDDDE